MRSILERNQMLYLVPHFRYKIFGKLISSTHTYHIPGLGFQNVELATRHNN